MTTPRFPSSTNLFVPEATGQVVGYINKPGRFMLWDYAQRVKSSRTGGDGKPVCLFTTIDPDEPVRVVTDQEFAWEDGEDAPEGANQEFNFILTEVRMFRRAYPYRLGEQANDTANLFKPMPLKRTMATSKAMTNKTARVWTLLDNAANWGANTADANVLNGGRGKWSQASATEGSPFYLAIKRSLLAGVQAINLATNSVVQPEDLKLVISPPLAMAAANSGEITDYLKGGTFAKMQQEGKERGKNNQYGFPDYYGGVEVVVEDACRVSERANTSVGTAATTNRNYIKDGTKACLMSRDGGLEGVEGSPNFSTLQVYYYKWELAVEEWFDAPNKVHRGRVIDQFKEVLASSRSGFLITNCQ
jgi:hypothetical protein